jgi:hypothetical protein
MNFAMLEEPYQISQRATPKKLMLGAALPVFRNFKTASVRRGGALQASGANRSLELARDLVGFCDA